MADVATLRDAVIRGHAPIVVVAASPEAERITALNGLRVVDLLQPFAELKSSPIHAHTLDNQSYPLHGFCLRFVDQSEFAQPPRDESDRKMDASVRACGDELDETGGGAAPGAPLVAMGGASLVATADRFAGGRRVRTPEEAIELIADDTDAAPWFTRYRRELHHALRCSEHEYVHHPLACLIVVSSAEENPLIRLQDIFPAQNLPPPFHVRGFLYPHLFRCHVILHDTCSGPPMERAEELYREMKKTFGSTGCALLAINSVKPSALRRASANPPQPDIWAPYLPQQRSARPRPASMLSAPQEREAEEDPLSAATAPAAAEAAAAGGDELDHPLRRVSTLSPMSAASLSPGGSAMASGGPRGALLSGDDLVAIEEFVHTLAQKSIVPHLERRIHTLNDLVAASRRGIKNQLRSWWTSKPAAVAPQRAPRDGSAVYPHSVMESHIRQLGDYCFMLQDYALSQQSYALVASDFRRDKALRHFAGTQEMSGLCLVASAGASAAAGRGSPAPAAPVRREGGADGGGGGSTPVAAAAALGYDGARDARWREAEQLLDAAYQAYHQAGSTRHATRVTLSLVDTLHMQGRRRDAAAALLRSVPSETDLRASLLLEQAALSFARMRPTPALRKYAFHLILAGHRFGQCSQRRHALRCYVRALAAYEGRGWGLIEDHIGFTLGRQAFHVGALRESASFFLHVLRVAGESHAIARRGPVPASGGDGSSATEQRQAACLREFLHVFKMLAAAEGRENEAVANLGVFRLEPSSVAVLLSEERGTGTDAPTAAPSSRSLSISSAPGTSDATARRTDGDVTEDEQRVWATMEAETEVAMRHGTTDGARSKPLMRGMRSAGVRGDGAVHTRRVCVIGEPVTVSFDLFGTLAMPATLTQLHLLARHDANDDEPPPAAVEGPWEGSETFDDATPTTADGDTPPFRIEVVDEVVVPPAPAAGGQGIRVRLRLTPLEEGRLQILGFACVFQGVVQTRQRFRLRRWRLHATLAQRSGRVYAPNRTLYLNVVGAALSLHVQMHDLPRTLFHGEVRRAVVELSNTGAAPLRRVCLKVSHPGILVVGRAEDVDVPFPPQPVAGAVSAAIPAPTAKDDDDGTSIAFLPLQSPDDRHDHGLLLSGHTVLFPLWLRGQQTGFQRLRFLFQYESNLAGDASSAPRASRTLRLAHELHVLSSIRASATLRPAPAPRLDQFLLSIEILNLSESRTARLVQVSAMSSAVVIKRLSNDEEAGNCALDHRCSRHVHFLVCPPASRAAGSRHCTSVPFFAESREGLSPEMAIDASLAPFPAFVARERAAVVRQRLAATSLRTASIARRPGESGVGGLGVGLVAYGAAPVPSGQRSAGSHQPPAAAARHNELDVIVLWESMAVGRPSSLYADTDAEGHAQLAQATPAILGAHLLTGLMLRWPARAVESPAPPARPPPVGPAVPLRMSVSLAARVGAAGPDGAAVLEHDFAAGGVCVVEVDVRVRNSCAPQGGPTLGCVVEALAGPTAAEPAILSAPEGAASAGNDANGDRKALPTPEATPPGDAPTSGSGAGDGSSATSSRRRRQAQPLRPRFLWMGPTRFSVPALAPEAEASVRLRACFVAPGLYDLACVRAVVHADGDGASPSSAAAAADGPRRRAVSLAAAAAAATDDGEPPEEDAAGVPAGSIVVTPPAGPLVHIVDAPSSQ